MRFFAFYTAFASNFRTINPSILESLIPKWTCCRYLSLRWGTTTGCTV